MEFARLVRSLVLVILALIVAVLLPAPRVMLTLPAEARPDSSTPVRASALTPVTSEDLLISSEIFLAESPAATVAVPVLPFAPVTVSVPATVVPEAGREAAATAVPKPVPARDRRSAPTFLAEAPLTVTPMVSLALEPTWKLLVPKLPSSSFWPPKVVVSAIRFSSDCSCLTSSFSA